MFSAQTYAKRRAELRQRVGSGLILLPGSVESPYGYPNNAYSFRQDSTFIYYFGLQNPALAGVLDTESGEDALYGDDFTVDDIIWTGPQPKLAELGEQVGVSTTYAMATLQEHIAQNINLGRKIHFLPPYRGETKIEMSKLLGMDITALHNYKSIDLMFAVAEMRECKSDEEIEELERAFKIGYKMHLTAMKMCRPGLVEREIAGAIGGIANSLGSGVSFRPIVTQHGEFLHNLNAEGTLESGRLLLCDAGAETINRYCSDHTRTYPVNGVFTNRQKDIYNIVVGAYNKAAETIAPYMKYKDVHNVALTSLAEGLIEIGLLHGKAEDAVESGAMALFMPHGLSHGLGMDVHDCEAFGERSFDFSAIAERAAESETCIYRSEWVFKPGTVISNEPGIYFIPALIDKSRAEKRYGGIVNYDMLSTYANFGGIRIEDDVIVTESGNKIIGDKKIPITVEELEAVVGK